MQYLIGSLGLAMKLAYYDGHCVEGIAWKK
jgi:hypothetical protein